MLFLIVAAFYWKITLTNQYTWLDSPDFANQVLPWYQFQASEWRQGRVPLWEPHQWGGQPLGGQAQPGVFYPPNWLLFLLPLKRGWIRQSFLEWYFVLVHYAAALFCYWLCRDLGRSRAASLLAGLGFALSGWMGVTDWPQMLNGAMWTPLVFLFLLRAVRGERPGRSAALAGAFLGVAFLSGHHQIPIFVTLACAGIWLWHLFPKGRFNPVLAGPAVLFGVFLFLLSALQTLPAYEYGTLAVRWVGADHPVGWKEPVPYPVHAEYGLRGLSVLGIVVPGISRHADPFVGIVLFSLALVAVAAAWRERTVRLLAVMAIAGLFFALSAHGLIQGVLYALVPMVDKARNPSMAVFIFHFGIAVLSAYGIDHYLFLDQSVSNRFVRVTAGFGVLVLGVLLVCSLAAVNFRVDPDRPAMVALIALLLALVLYAFRHHNLGASALAGIGGLLLVEASLGNSMFFWHSRSAPNLLLKKLAQDTDIVEFLRRQTGPVRVEVDEQAIPYNFGDWHGVDTSGGYLASVTANVQRVASSHTARMLLGTRYYIGAKPQEQAQVEVFRGASGLKVYMNPEAFPRAWAVHKVVTAAQGAEIERRLEAPLPRLREEAFVTGAAPALETCAEADSVRMARRTAKRVEVEAIMGCRGMVVVGDAFFPGWQAKVDGRPVPVHEAYGFLRGVVVERGRHRIEMVYRPASVILGGVLTAIGLIGVALLALRK